MSGQLTPQQLSQVKGHLVTSLEALKSDETTSTGKKDTTTETSHTYSGRTRRVADAKTLTKQELSAIKFDPQAFQEYEGAISNAVKSVFNYLLNEKNSHLTQEQLKALKALLQKDSSGKTLIERTVHSLMEASLKLLRTSDDPKAVEAVLKQTVQNTDQAQILSHLMQKDPSTGRIKLQILLGNTSPASAGSSETGGVNSAYEDGSASGSGSSAQIPDSWTASLVSSLGVSMGPEMLILVMKLVSMAVDTLIVLLKGSWVVAQDYASAAIELSQIQSNGMYASAAGQIIGGSFTIASAAMQGRIDDQEKTYLNDGNELSEMDRTIAETPAAEAVMEGGGAANGRIAPQDLEGGAPMPPEEQAQRDKEIQQLEDKKTNNTITETETKQLDEWKRENTKQARFKEQTEIEDLQARIYSGDRMITPEEEGRVKDYNSSETVSLRKVEQRTDFVSDAKAKVDDLQNKVKAAKKRERERLRDEGKLVEVQRDESTFTLRTRTKGSRQAFAKERQEMEIRKKANAEVFNENTPKGRANIETLQEPAVARGYIDQAGVRRGAPSAFKDDDSGQFKDRVEPAPERSEALQELPENIRNKVVGSAKRIQQGDPIQDQVNNDPGSYVAEKYLHPDNRANLNEKRTKGRVATDEARQFRDRMGQLGQSFNMLSMGVTGCISAAYKVDEGEQEGLKQTDQASGQVYNSGSSVSSTNLSNDSALYGSWLQKLSAVAQAESQAATSA